MLTVLAKRGHLAADDVAAAVRERLGSVSTQATYDVLRACTGAGIVRRIEPDGSPALYELRVGDNHHHLICRVCRAIEDVSCAVDSKPCLDPIDDHGYVIDEAEVVYWGVCPACAKASSVAPAPSTSPYQARATHEPQTKE